MHFREANSGDIERIIRLYKVVAAKEGGIVRFESEITEEYVTDFVSKSISNGLIIVCEHPDDSDEIIAEIHAHKSGLRVFDHVLSNLTVVVHPAFQGKKIGTTLFRIFLTEVAQHRPDICKVELVTRESNSGAIRLYQSVGFKIEGRLEMRIRTSERHYEADIPMGWQNPNYEF